MLWQWLQLGVHAAQYGTRTIAMTLSQLELALVEGERNKGAKMKNHLRIRSKRFLVFVHRLALLRGAIIMYSLLVLEDKDNILKDTLI